MLSPELSGEESSSKRSVESYSYNIWQTFFSALCFALISNKNMNILLTFVIIIFTVWIQLEGSHAAEGVNFFNFLTSATSTKDDQRISFSPDDGKKFRRSFEQRYGPRGRLLIESMGRGLSTSTPKTEKSKGNGTKHILKIEKKIINPGSTISSILSTSPQSVTVKQIVIASDG